MASTVDFSPEERARAKDNLDHMVDFNRMAPRFGPDVTNDTGVALRSVRMLLALAEAQQVQIEALAWAIQKLTTPAVAETGGT